MLENLLFKRLTLAFGLLALTTAVFGIMTLRQSEQKYTLIYDRAFSQSLSQKYPMPRKFVNPFSVPSLTAEVTIGGDKY